MTRLGPSAVAVHDDCEVTGQPLAHSSAHRARVPCELPSFKTSRSIEPALGIENDKDSPDS